MKVYRNQLLYVRVDILANHINTDTVLGDSVFWTKTQIASTDSDSSLKHFSPRGDSGTLTILPHQDLILNFLRRSCSSNQNSGFLLYAKALFSYTYYCDLM